MRLLKEIEKKAEMILKDVDVKSIRRASGILRARFRLDKKTSILLIKRLKRKKALKLGISRF